MRGSRWTWLGALALLLLSPPARGDDELARILRTLRTESDGGQRRILAAKLALIGTPKAAAKLEELVRTDPEPGVRVAAVEGLGAVPLRDVGERLVELTARGGVRGVRAALGRVLGAREDGPDLLEKYLLHPRTDPLSRGLLLRALAHAPGPEARDRLRAFVAHDDPFLREEAVRALVEQDALGADEWVALLEDLIRKRRDTGTLMAALDTLEDHPDPRLLPAVELLETFLEPAMKEAVAHALAVLRWEKWKGEAAKATAEGYGAPPKPPGGKPPVRPRYDLVFLFDGTGSVSGHLPRIREWIETRYRFLVGVGADVRVGVVVYRDDQSHQTRAPVQVRPLTYDFARVEEFFEDLKMHGADAGGAAVHLGLSQALDRMAWRWTAARSAWLIADSGCGDAGESRDLASIHRVADATRLHVNYLLRTRRSVPDSIRALAEAGGGTVELLD